MRELSTTPDTMRNSRIMGFQADADIVQKQGNSSSEQVRTRSASCTGPKDDYTCGDLASRDRIAHKWEVKRRLEQKRELQTDEDRWWSLKRRRQTHALDHPTTPGATSSSVRTLLDLLLEESTSAWRVESDFMIEAGNLRLSNVRQQDLKTRSAAHQCFGTLMTKQNAKPLIRFKDRIIWGQSHGMLTRAQAEHLQTLRHKECVH